MLRHISMRSGSSQSSGPPAIGPVSARATLRARLALVLLAVLAAANVVRAEDRLESPSFGNIGDARFSRNYPALNILLLDGHVIPGLHWNFVPQGIDFLTSHPDKVVLSGYFCERFSTWRQGFIRRCRAKRSAVYLYDLNAGKAVRLALLEESNGLPMRRHAGGVAELYDRLWLPDNFVVFRFDLGELLGARDPVITMRPENETPIGVDSSGDFITAFDDGLWIGNFQRRDRGRPLPAHYRSPVTGTHGWTAGYRIDPDTLRPTSRKRYQVSFGGEDYEVYRPDAAIHHRNKIQGISFTDNRGVVLSASYGNRFSALAFHRLPAAPFRDTVFGEQVTLPDGTSLQVQSLGLKTRSHLITAPPGAEGVAYNGTVLTVAFEGGALPYRERWRRIEDRFLLFLPPPAFIRDR